jgi:hypothetical protein
MCNLGWVDPPKVCDVYEGQKAGGFDNSNPVPNRNGRTDTEGCVDNVLFECDVVLGLINARV